MLKIGSLFSGTGLCDLGFHRAGFTHSWFCEIDPFCRSVLARHWPGVPIYKDVRELDPATLPAVDVLVGGFPCQDVSSAGRRRGIAQSTRSGLWHEYKRIINGVRPRYAVIENVKGLLSRGMEIVLQDISSIGYAAEWQCLPAAAFGAPHIRERVFILAYPHSDQSHAGHGLLFEKPGDMGGQFELGRVATWRGVRIDRGSRQAIRQAYRGPALCRVDYGYSGGLDGVGRPKPGVPLISSELHKTWLPRLKALGNGVTPQQAYFVACCILLAEGLPLLGKNKCHLDV
jgi:DNA (cytosine-5)-methyltransferase 1